MSEVTHEASERFAALFQDAIRRMPARQIRDTDTGALRDPTEEEQAQYVAALREQYFAIFREKAR